MTNIVRGLFGYLLVTEAYLKFGSWDLVEEIQNENRESLLRK
jgi:hypothetical protein